MRYVSPDLDSRLPYLPDWDNPESGHIGGCPLNYSCTMLVKTTYEG